MQRQQKTTKFSYAPYVKKIIPVLKEIQGYAGRMVGQIPRAEKGAVLASIFSEVQKKGGVTSEFLEKITKEAGGTGIFKDLYKNLNELGLDFALDGATGKRVKNATQGDLTAQAGGQSFSIRSSPKALADGSNVLGELNHSFEVLGPVVSKVVDKDSKTEFMGIQIKKEGLSDIKLNNGKKLKDLPNTVWIGAGGLRTTVKWKVFMEQLSNFDIMTTGMSLSEKLTKLRQFGQKKDIGSVMDRLIGTKKRSGGHRYQDDRVSYSNVFQLLKEVDQVETPLGVVDMHHFLTALESYKKKNKDVDMNPYWRDFGKMKDGGSFAGNIGAAAAEYVLRNSKHWEKTVGKGASDAVRMDFYYKTRTTEEELLGELDGWGALGSFESGKVTTLVDLINGYYGKGAPTAKEKKAGKEHPRKAAMTKFISEYGLTTKGGTLDNGVNIALLYPRNLIFAQGWWKTRSATFGEKTSLKDLKDPTLKMTKRFVKWLDARAKEYGVFDKKK